MASHNFSNLQMIIRDIKCHKYGHKKEILANIGILALLLTLIIIAVVKIHKARHSSIEISTHHEIIIPIVPTTLPLEEKEDMVFEALTDAGFSVAGACGIMGNISIESPNFDPTAIGPGGGPYGLFQWTNVGRRKHHMNSWCKENNLSPDSIEGQIAFAIYEISGGDSIAVRLDKLLRETDDPYTACAEFAAGFERCVADRDNGCGTYTGSLYPEFYGMPYQGLNKRINHAMNYYERFTSRPPKMTVYNTNEYLDASGESTSDGSSNTSGKSITINLTF